MPDLAPDLEIGLDRVISAPHDARNAISTLLGGAAHDDFWQNALLATSEIVTHSLTNSTGRCQLSAWHSATSGFLRVEVTDGAGELPSLQPESSHPDLGELRLAVLLQVPSAWGVERTPFGRTVWFEIHRSDAGTVEPNLVEPMA